MMGNKMILVYVSRFSILMAVHTCLCSSQGFDGETLHSSTDITVANQTYGFSSSIPSKQSTPYLTSTQLHRTFHSDTADSETFQSSSNFETDMRYVPSTLQGVLSSQEPKSASAPFATADLNSLKTDIYPSPDSTSSKVYYSSTTEQSSKISPYSSFPLNSVYSSSYSQASSPSGFHTPLMSLLAASSSILWPVTEASAVGSNNSAQPLTMSPFDNEVPNSDHSPVPTDVDHKILLMIVLRAEDCAKFSKPVFEKMIGKWMESHGYHDVIPEISNAKCYSHLNINITLGGPTPMLTFLPNVDGKVNFSVDVLNRTFRVVKMEKFDYKIERSKPSNSSSSIITAVTKQESVAYVTVGISFGMIIVVCVAACCIKCFCFRKPAKRFNVCKGTHVRLRPEDYTLTPIPRPTSLYVDYYRGSVIADLYSTTSAGSIASTTPTVEQGVVQPFDTSIVPLEDSSALPIDSSRDPSVESVPVHSDLKTFNIHSLSGKNLRGAATDSKEHLTLSKKTETKPGGVANPTFQRY